MVALVRGLMLLADRVGDVVGVKVYPLRPDSLSDGGLVEVVVAHLSLPPLCSPCCIIQRKTGGWRFPAARQGRGEGETSSGRVPPLPLAVEPAVDPLARARLVGQVDPAPAPVHRARAR